MKMPWIPKYSGTDEGAGCMWLPRLIDKARRVAADGEYLIDGEYMYGEHDFSDGRVLKFLGLSGDRVIDVVRAEPDDAAAAARIVAMSGRSALECAAFNRRLRLLVGPFLPMMDADEGRRPATAWTSVLRWTYNTLVYPPARLAFRLMERR